MHGEEGKIKLIDEEDMKNPNNVVLGYKTKNA